MFLLFVWGLGRFREMWHSNLTPPFSFFFVRFVVFCFFLGGGAVFVVVVVVTTHPPDNKKQSHDLVTKNRCLEIRWIELLN